MVHVEVGEEEVDAAVVGRYGAAQPADAGAGVEHDDRAVAQRHLHARRVAAVARRTITG